MKKAKNWLQISGSVITMKNEYYSLKKINKLNALYNLIIGQRSNGKTYSVCKQEIEGYFKENFRLAYIRRYDEEIMPKNIQNLFKPHSALIEKLSNGQFNSTTYKNREFYLYNKDTEEKSEQSFCKCFSLNAWERTKGADNGYFKYILFDEFMTRSFYLNNEFVTFTQLLSSIIRDRDNTIIYMIANTVNQYCPYFAEMGLGKISDIKQGDLKLFTYGDSELTLALEYSDSRGQTGKVSKYFAFDNPQLKMITTGQWEIKNYPHAPFKIKKENIVYRAYIFFDNDVIACNIIHYENTVFLFFNIQTKTENLELKKRVVYSFETDANPLHVQSLAEQPTDVHKLINNLITFNRVFYADNSVGEIVRNWINAQSKHSISLRT